MSVHLITERLSHAQLLRREEHVFANMYKCPRGAFGHLANIQLWHKQRVHDNILNGVAEGVVK